MRVLLAEDDPQLGIFVKEGLSREGFAVDVAKDGKEALELISGNPYDVVLLDVMMPKLNGFEVLSQLRREKHRGIVMMLTCQGQEEDKLRGFDIGADDYLVKPFLLTELTARIRAVLRRSSPVNNVVESAVQLVAGDIVMDLMKHSVRRAGKAIDLTKKEFELLEYFMRRPGRLLTQTAILQVVWNADYESNSNVVEVHLNRLRQKLNKGFSKDPIQTLHGSGYLFQP